MAYNKSLLFAMTLAALLAVAFSLPAENPEGSAKKVARSADLETGNSYGIGYYGYGGPWGSYGYPYGGAYGYGGYGYPYGYAYSYGYPHWGGYYWR